MAKQSNFDASVPSANGAAIDWEERLREHQGWLRSVIIARVGEAQAVDDVMQEVALAVVANRAPLAEPSKLAPWLYQIAIRQSLLYRRKHGRRRKLVDRYAERLQPRESDSRSPDPLQWLLADEQAAQIRVAMQELSGRDREILLLKYHHGWSYREISSQLQISASAVEARLHRARKRLRSQLAKLDVVKS